MEDKDKKFGTEWYDYLVVGGLTILFVLILYAIFFGGNTGLFNFFGEMFMLNNIFE